MDGVHAGSAFLKFSSGINQLINDDVLFRLGTDGDHVFLNRSSILNANTSLTNVLIGTPVAQALAANSLIISNVTASGDIAMYGNLGGNSQQFLFYDTSAGSLYLRSASDGAVYIGNSASNIGVFGTNRFSWDGVAYTYATATNFGRVEVRNTNAITINTATVPVLASMILNEPNITIGTGAVTEASTLYISGKPSEGTTNSALSVYTADDATTNYLVRFVSAGSSNSNNVLLLKGGSDGASNRILSCLGYSSVEVNYINGLGAVGMISTLATKNAVHDILTLTTRTNSTSSGANGLGVGISLRAIDDSANIEEIGRINSFWISNVHPSTNTANMGFKVLASTVMTLAHSDATILSTNYARVNVPAGTAITVNTGTVPVFATLSLSEPNITIGTGAVTTAATLYIAGAPTEGSTNNSIYVSSGTSYFGGHVGIMSPSNVQMSLYVEEAYVVATDALSIYGTVQGDVSVHKTTQPWTQDTSCRAFTSNARVGASNTQNWTMAIGLRGLSATVLATAGATGTITGAAGVYSNCAWAAATLTNRYGVYVTDATGAGTVTNQYGIYIEALTKGATLNVPVAIDRKSVV